MFSDGGLPEDVYATCATRSRTSHDVPGDGALADRGPLPERPWLLELQPRPVSWRWGSTLRKGEEDPNGDTVEFLARGKIERSPSSPPVSALQGGRLPRSTGWVSPGARLVHAGGGRLRQPADADGGGANTMIPETKAFMVNITAKGDRHGPGTRGISSSTRRAASVALLPGRVQGVEPHGPDKTVEKGATRTRPT